MPLTLPLPLEVESWLVFLLLLPIHKRWQNWKRSRRLVESKQGSYGKERDIVCVKREAIDSPGRASSLTECKLSANLYNSRYITNRLRRKVEAHPLHMFEQCGAVTSPM